MSERMRAVPSVEPEPLEPDEAKSTAKAAHTRARTEALRTLEQATRLVRMLHEPGMVGHRDLVRMEPVARNVLDGAREALAQLELSIEAVESGARSLGWNGRRR